MKVTVLALTLNESEGVKAILPRIPRDRVDQLLVVDGGSTDGSSRCWEAIRILLRLTTE